ncbi:MAG TPA: aldehyde dehydrogenase family protein [Pyrinomonadaceae bacterium]|jgi:succinate-semialdehyde dehydrogenase/glutarate-semialdehyde dehydrogenase|nr:aldehyde dehydrogenase family protein [Pyrinomonadaceae bacterium]
MATLISQTQKTTLPHAESQTGTKREIVSYDPATGAELGRVPLRSAEEVGRAVERARGAQESWREKSYRERAGVVMRARAIVLAEMEEIAELISRESGKPVTEAFSMEITPTLDLMRYFARSTARLLRDEKINLNLYGFMGRSSIIVYRPLGVVAIISPWNFPWAIPLGEVVMALMAGNAVVLKPSELTPLVALKIGDVFERAGLPEGLLEIVTGDGSTGQSLTEARVDKIMFTGSVATGRRVAETAARRLIPVVLELGGKDPMIVFEDADLESAARAAVWGAFANSGQACASVERCYVHESIARDFTERVVAKTRALTQHVGTREDTDIGAMSSERQTRIVEQHVSDAVERGARVLAGGSRLKDAPGSGAFHEPTVLEGVNHTMAVMREETFGPVLPLMTFGTEEEAVRLANDSEFGLTASVWTRDIRRGRRVASRIEAGTVMVNEVLYTHGIAQTPWGGVKGSGMGRTHGRLGLLELVAPHHVHVNRLARLHDVWWFNYTPQAAALFRNLARRFATGSLLQTLLVSPQMLRRIFEKRSSRD